MEPETVIITWKKMGPGLREAVLVSGALLLVISLAFIWAAFLRKRRRVHRHHRSHYDNASSIARSNSSEGKGFFTRGRKRRKRKEHRSINPTLAETGGLPPVRPPPR